MTFDTFDLRNKNGSMFSIGSFLSSEWDFGLIDHVVYKGMFSLLFFLFSPVQLFHIIFLDILDTIFQRSFGVFGSKCTGIQTSIDP
jgi:hypothetical protein